MLIPYHFYSDVAVDDVCRLLEIKVADVQESFPLTIYFGKFLKPMTKKKITSNFGKAMGFMCIFQVAYNLSVNL